MNVSWNLWPLISSNLSKHVQSIWLFPKLLLLALVGMCIFTAAYSRIECLFSASLWGSYHTHLHCKLQYIGVWNALLHTRLLSKQKQSIKAHAWKWIVIETSCCMQASLYFSHFLWHHLCDPGLLSWNQLATVWTVHTHLHVPPINTHAHTCTPTHHPMFCYGCHLPF